MSIPPGAHEYGPENATLRVKTGRHGAAAKAGHDLVIDVTSWRATLEADPRSLRVHEGVGGIQPLGDEDREEIARTIDDQVLEGHPIRFSSSEAEAADEGGTLRFSGSLELAGQSHAIGFELSVDAEGRIAGGATLAQTDWGIKPYSGLFGALKVDDEVAVAVEAGPPAG